MNDKPNPIQILEKLNLPKAFRSNILFIMIFSALFQVFYYPFFFYKRRKALQQSMKIKRYALHIAIPFCGFALFLLANFAIATIVGVKEGMLHQDEIIAGTFTSADIVNTMLDKYGTLVHTVTQVGYVTALLCFVLPAIDLLVLLSEHVKSLRVKFPKLLHHTPVIFTVGAFIHIFLEVFQLGFMQELQLVNRIAQFLFCILVVLFHIYLANVYLLTQTFSISKGDTQ